MAENEVRPTLDTGVNVFTKSKEALDQEHFKARVESSRNGLDDIIVGLLDNVTAF